MIFQRINRDDPEKVFIIVYNSYSSAALTNGQAVQWDFTGDANGVGVTRPTARATNGGLATAGIAAEGIAAGAYGLLQVYGYHSAVRCRAATGGTPAIAAGVPLSINAAGSLFCLESIATASDAIWMVPCGFGLAALTTWTTAAIAAFVKCL